MRQGLLVAAIVVGVVSPVGAQPALPAKASSEAVRVVVGTVIRVLPRHVVEPNGDEVIVSRVTVAVEDVLQGPPSAVIETETLGGTVNGLTMASSWMPVLTVGDKAEFRLDRSNRPIRVHGEAVVLVENPDAFKINGPTWGPSAVPFYVNPANADVPPSTAILAIQTGMEAWGDQSQADFGFVYAGTTNATAFLLNRKNEIFFSNVNAGGLVAEAHWWYSGSLSTGTLIDADIKFYDGGFRFFTGTSGCSGGLYLEDVTTHEAGHALGLGHSSVSGATMAPSIAFCSTAPRSLAADDIAAVESLYPPDGSEPPPPPPPDPDPTPPPTGSIALTVTTKEGSAYQYVYFTWTGITGSPAEIWRDGVKVSAPSNDGYTILSYPLSSHVTTVFKMCVLGGAPCSPNVSVTW